MSGTTQTPGIEAGRFSRRGSAAEVPLRIALEELGVALDARAPEIHDAVRMRLAREVPELRALDDPELVQACRHTIAANVHAGLAHLRADADEPEDVPIDARHLARLWAQRGVPPQLLLRCHAVAQTAAWDAVVDAIEDADPPPALRGPLLRRASHIVFGYVNGAARHVLDAYEAERTEAGSPELRRLRLIERVLAGEDDRGFGLGYDLTAQHLGFVAWGRGAAAFPERLRERTERRLLVVRPTDRTVWGWAGGRDELSPAEQRAFAQTPEQDQVAVAFGALGRGVAGFRATFEQARQAQRVAVSSGRCLVFFRDVALEALAGRDADSARSFVAAELGPLAGDDPKSVQLRETLRAYFVASGNAAACAAALGVHDQTVAYRLRRIEERLGHSVASRRPELEVALRLAPVVGF